MNARSGDAILVVDDERSLADTMAEILERAGYRIYTAYGAAEALERLQELRPALLITDVMMPGMDGVELARKASRLCPGIRIFLISGHAGAAEIAGSVHEPRLDLLPKPIPPEELLLRVGSVLGAPRTLRPKTL
jgi:CheY-like chemotaxis protein